MNNSNLVDCKVLSPNHSGKRTRQIKRITPHCVVGQLKAEAIGDCFPQGRNASCNYGIGTDGRVCLIVPEEYRSWCSSSRDNDQQAITIECASDKTHPYAMNNAVYNKLIELCVDICQRSGVKKLLWIDDKEKSLAYNPKDDEMIITVHRWFENKSCPGDWLYNRLGELASKVTERLGSTSEIPQKSDTIYRVQVGAYKNKANADLQLEKIKEAGFTYAYIVQIDNIYKVQVGAYYVKENAEAQRNKLKYAGFSAFVTTKCGTSVSYTPKKTVDELAREVIQGKWGTGQNRKYRLTQAGYDYNAVQKRVNEIL